MTLLNQTQTSQHSEHQIEALMTITLIVNRTQTSQLSERETEVLMHIACGKSNKQIAKEMSLHPETIKTYVSNAIDKLYALDRTHAVVLAIDKGILFPKIFIKH